MNFSDLTDKQKSLIAPKDRQQFGKAGKTFAEAEAGAEARAEKHLQEQYKAFLHRYELTDYINPPMHKRSMLPAGHPDFTVFHNGLTLFVEFKVAKNKLSKEQENRITNLRNQGFTVLVEYSYESAYKHTLDFFNL